MLLENNCLKPRFSGVHVALHVLTQTLLRFKTTANIVNDNLYHGKKPKTIIYILLYKVSIFVHISYN